MTRISKPLKLADPSRFNTIQDLTRMRPDCGASIDDIVAIDNESLCIIDLSNIGSLLNPYNSLEATYVRSHGVIVGSYSFSESAPVLWRDPFLLLPLSHHLKGNLKIYAEIGEIIGNVSCPSGSLLLMPLRNDIPISIKKGFDEAIAKTTSARIELPNGTYRVFYEQFETPEGAKKELFQNIVVQRQ